MDVVGKQNVSSFTTNKKLEGNQRQKYTHHKRQLHDDVLEVTNMITAVVQ